MAQFLFIKFIWSDKLKLLSLILKWENVFLMPNYWQQLKEFYAKFQLKFFKTMLKLTGILKEILSFYDFIMVILIKRISNKKKILHNLS